MRKRVNTTVFYFVAVLWCILSGTAFCAPPARIVSLAPNITEILYDLGLGDRVVAVTTFCDYPPEAVNKPKIGGYANPSLEAVVAMKPDLVIMSDDGNPLEMNEKLTRLGIRTHAFRAKRLKELPQGIRDLGIALDIKKEAFKKAEKIEREIHRYERNLSKTAHQRPRKKAIFIIQPEPLMVAGPGTVIDDSLTLLGLQNIASDAGSQYPKYSIEEVIRRSPDIIFVGKGPMMGQIFQNLLKRLTMLDAIKKGRVFYTSESLYRLGPRVITGIKELEGYLHAR
ncbi:MAG: hypothetical protein FJ139_03225 [Deltaproteobacteria bacterium]|nr:hypothetical protein [Deltaproteobacteria bacterium]